MTFRRLARSAASSRPAAALVNLLERLDSGRSDVLAVLTYHHVADPSPADPHPGLYVTPAAFEEHLDVLMARYVPVSVHEVLEVRRGRGRLPHHAVLLTFDDAYRDFATTAWPLLRERSIPATLFVPTGYPDHPDRWFWWERLGQVLGAAGEETTIATPLGDLPVATRADRSRAYAVLREHCKAIGVDASVDLVRRLADQAGLPGVESDVLGWDELRQLAADGAVLAPHSRTHALMTRVSDEQLVEELEGSRADLVRELGDCIGCFAYPSGDAEQREADAAAAAGYELAFTTRRGVNRLDDGEWTALRRVNVGGGANATLLRAQIGRWMTLAPR